MAVLSIDVQGTSHTEATRPSPKEFADRLQDHYRRTIVWLADGTCDRKSERYKQVRRQIRFAPFRPGAVGRAVRAEQNNDDSALGYTLQEAARSREAQQDPAVIDGALHSLNARATLCMRNFDTAQSMVTQAREQMWWMLYRNLSSAAEGLLVDPDTKSLLLKLDVPACVFEIARERGDRNVMDRSLLEYNDHLTGTHQRRFSPRATRMADREVARHTVSHLPAFLAFLATSRRPAIQSYVAEATAILGSLPTDGRDPRDLDAAQRASLTQRYQTMNTDVCRVDLYNWLKAECRLRYVASILHDGLRRSLGEDIPRGPPGNPDPFQRLWKE